MEAADIIVFGITIFKRASTSDDKSNICYLIFAKIADFVESFSFENNAFKVIYAEADWNEWFNTTMDRFLSQLYLGYIFTYRSIFCLGT